MTDKGSTDGGLAWVGMVVIVIGGIVLGASVGALCGHNLVGAVFGGTLAATVMGFELWRQRDDHSRHL